MVQSKAATVEDYLAELPPERREMIAAVRQVVLENLPEGYEERMQWGMISYVIPLEVFPNTYNKQPLGYVAIASQKNYCSLHLMGVYADEKLLAKLLKAYEQMGVKPDMGKGCLRFRTLDALPLAAIGKIIAAVKPSAYIRTYEASRNK